MQEAEVVPIVTLYVLLHRDPDGEVCGLIWVKGRTWRDLRRFSARSLKELGASDGDLMEVIITQEAEAMLDTLWKDSDDGSLPVSIRHRFTPYVNNVVSDFMVKHTRLKDVVHCFFLLFRSGDC